MIPGRQIAIALTLLGTAGVVACSDLESPVDPEPESIWSASLAPITGVPDPGAPLVTGQAAAVVHNGRTDISIQLDGLETPLGWGLFEGSCTEPGAQLGSADDYPALSPDDPSVETQLSTELSPTESYNVRAGSEPDGSSAITCGELVLSDEV